jgi:hypothetical protein
MAINPNNGVLDIINGTLKVSSIDIKQAGGFSTAINTVARNNVLLFDDQKSTTTFMPTAQGGYMSSTGVTRDTTAGYLELGTASDEGWVYWPLQLPNSWHTEFDMHVTATGGVLTFSLFNTSEPNHTDFTNNDGGYKIVFDNTNNQIVVYWEGSVHKTVSASLRSNDWQHVNVNYSQGATSVSLAGKVVLTHEFTQNYQEFDSRYVGFSATAGTSHKIRHLRIHNGDKWLYTKTSNASDITYVSGNVGIGSLAPTELLDVHGNVHIAQHLTVDGDFTVTGTTTYVDTTNATIEDPILELAKGNTSDTIDAGLIVSRGASNVAIAFRGDEEELAFGYTESGASGADVTPIADGGLDVRVYGNLFANNLTTTANVEATYLKGDGSEITQVTLDQVVGYANTTANTIQLTNSDVGLKATGNVEAEYFVGNGSKLTGLVTDLQSVADNGNTSSNTIQFTNATTAFVANSNVGIGTATPSANLHVMGYQYVNGPPTLANAFDHSDAPLTLTHGTATSSTAINDPKPLLHLTRSGTSSQSYGARASFNLSRYENSSTHSRSRLDVALADGTYAESTVMSLRSDGKVGVGTVTPAYTLDVHGSANVGALTATTISGPVSGNASTATALATARAIGGLSFDGTADITLPGVNAPGTQNTSGNATTATTATNQSGGTVNATTIAGQSISLANNIVHTSDTTTSFGFPGTGTIDFFTAGSERMRIASDGSVGIGTASPGTKLNMKGGVFLAENQASTNNQILYGDGGGTGGNNNSYTIANAKFGTGVFVNDTGTTGSTITLVNKEGANNVTKHASIGFVNTDTTANGKFGGQIGFWPEDANASKQQFRIYTSGASAGYNLPVQRMVVDGDGNVGIGTATPNYILNISTDTNYDGISLRDSTRELLKIAKGSNGSYINMFESGTSKVNISTGGDSYINGGNVGIGESSPAQKLDVNGRIRANTMEIDDFIYHVGDTDTSFGFTGADSFAVYTGNSQQLLIDSGGVQGQAFVKAGDTNTMMRFPAADNIAFMTGGTDRVQINSSGNVGIGTTSPDQILHLLGQGTGSGPKIRFETLNNGNGDYTVDGTEIGGIQFAADDLTWATQHTSSEIVGIHRDPNYSGAQGVLVFKTSSSQGSNPTEKMRINHDGNVGIGTTGPDAQLHIGPKDNDHIYLASANNRYGWILDTVDQMGGVVPFRIIKRRDNVDITTVTIDNANGSVGIGTATFTDSRNSGGIHIANSKGISFAADSSQSNSRHWRIRTDDYSDWGSLQFSVSDNNSTHPDASDEHVMTMTKDRHVGIGVASPTSCLEVRSGTTIPVLRGDAGRAIYQGSGYNIVNSSGFSETSTNYAWGGYPGVVKTTSDGEWRAHGQSGYTVLVRSDIGFAPFTGLHETYLPFDEDDKGMIVYSTGNYASELKDGNVDGVMYDYLTISDACPIVKICTTENDKRVMGVLSTRHQRTQIKEITEEEYELITGDEKYAYDKKEDSNVYVCDSDTGEFSKGYYNAVGEGGIWVCNKNGDLENGDYITSSAVAGYGQKQNDDLLHNYTVAKITTDCDFSEIWVTTKKHKKTKEGYAFNDNNEPVYENILDDEGNTRTHLKFKIRYLLPDATQISKSDYDTKLAAGEEVYKAAFVGCTYHCG